MDHACYGCFVHPACAVQLSDPPSQNDTSARYYAGIFDIEHRDTGKHEDVMKLDWGPVEVVPSHRYYRILIRLSQATSQPAALPVSCEPACNSFCTC